jgi:hypothetical protein
MHRISCGSARADPSLTAGRSDEAFRTARDRWPREHCRHDGDRFRRSFQESCQLNTNAPGSGELLFKAGRLRFRIVENRVGPTASLSLTGRRGGSAGAIAAVNSPDPAGVLEQCAMGGIASVPVDLAIQTAPTISG